MNKLAQMGAWTIIFGIGGVIFAWWMSGTMTDSFIWRAITAIVVGVVCGAIGYAGENM